MASIICFPRYYIAVYSIQLAKIQAKKDLYLYSVSATPIEVSKALAERHKALCKQLKEMAERSGVSLGSLKRFENTGKISLESLLKLAHLMSHLMDCAFRLEKHVHVYEKVFRLVAFNVFAHNWDDHSKNFSFLMDAQGNWKMAPAYDLTFSTLAYGIHSTMVAGESKNIGETHLIKLANHFGLKNPDLILQQVKETISQWRYIALDCGISKQVITEIEKTLIS